MVYISGSYKSMKWFVFLGLIAVSTASHAGIYEFLFGNDNCYECILYEMPEAESDQETNEIYKQCKQDYPLSIPLIRKESYLGVETADQCLKEFVHETSISVARGWIKQACSKVYLRKK